MAASSLLIQQESAQNGFDANDFNTDQVRLFELDVKDTDIKGCVDFSKRKEPLTLS